MDTNPREGYQKFLGGGGGLQSQILEAKYEAKLDFPGGSGSVNQKRPSMGGVWIFSGTAHFINDTVCRTHVTCGESSKGILDRSNQKLRPPLPPDFNNGKMASFA